MAKVIFNTFLEACEFSKNLAMATKTPSTINRDCDSWWIDDPRIEQFSNCSAEDDGHIPRNQHESQQHYNSTVENTLCNSTDFDEEGYDVHGYDRDGYSKRGLNKCGFDRDGYGEDGFDRDDFSRLDIHRCGARREDLYSLYLQSYIKKMNKVRTNFFSLRIEHQLPEAELIELTIESDSPYDCYNCGSSLKYAYFKCTACNNFVCECGACCCDINSIRWAAEFDNGFEGWFPDYLENYDDMDSSTCEGCGHSLDEVTPDCEECAEREEERKKQDDRDRFLLNYDLPWPTVNVNKY